MDAHIAEDYKLTAKDVAAILSVSERTIYNWRAKKCGPPYIKLGIAYRYSRRSLEDWLQNKIGN